VSTYEPCAAVVSPLSPWAAVTALRNLVVFASSIKFRVQCGDYLSACPQISSSSASFERGQEGVGVVG
jgi:hypothetical protein